MIDHSGLQVQTRKMFIEEAIECVIDVALNHEEVLSLLTKESHDLVILDHTTQSCQETAQYILDLNPLQSILVVSSAPKCIITRCEDCVSHHHARRLSNPTSINNIIRMIREFKETFCNHYDPATNTLIPANSGTPSLCSDPLLPL